LRPNSSKHHGWQPAGRKFVVTMMHARSCPTAHSSPATLVVDRRLQAATGDSLPTEAVTRLLDEIVALKFGGSQQQARGGGGSAKGRSV
jgi:hypothetical protein